MKYGYVRPQWSLYEVVLDVWIVYTGITWHMDTSTLWQCRSQPTATEELVHVFMLVMDNNLIRKRERGRERERQRERQRYRQRERNRERGRERGREREAERERHRDRKSVV